MSIDERLALLSSIILVEPAAAGLALPSRLLFKEPEPLAGESCELQAGDAPKPILGTGFVAKAFPTTSALTPAVASHGMSFFRCSPLAARCPDASTCGRTEDAVQAGVPEGREAEGGGYSRPGRWIGTSVSWSSSCIKKNSDLAQNAAKESIYSANSIFKITKFWRSGNPDNGRKWKRRAKYNGHLRNIREKRTSMT
jgi:hypothetical protein